MDALYHRLLVADFPACFDFYRAVLPPLTGAALVKGTPDGPYATWDLDGQAVLSLFDRGLLAATVGTAALPAEPAAATQDGTMLVFRVNDVGQAFDLCLRHGAAPVVGPTDRPDWGPGLRTAHLRDPEGRLIELQSY
ncbi:glyoxalase/bleomycin resistance/extradiol dioxygenase family protein [Kitasatospora purpeofusca]|uniref:VOC family protein n=1 Tax=Kitasatospora purpeofusca TaxID=67352 RepID=UPI002E1553ED|nr:glyoxalase/bleomycin resistance/extradiol dioxygenase family protein [Kitasatospora purpeofusca]